MPSKSVVQLAAYAQTCPLRRKARALQQKDIGRDINLELDIPTCTKIYFLSFKFFISTVWCDGMP